MDAGARRGGRLLRAGKRFGARAGPFARGFAWLFALGFDNVLEAVDRGLMTGAIHATLPDGTRRVLGGRAPGFACEVTLHDWRALVRLAIGGSAGWYQAWAAGEWSSPDPVPLFALFMANGENLGETARSKGPWRVAARALHWLNRNSRAGARRNIHAHYDLGSDFYAAWLGETMLYSSALFAGNAVAGSGGADALAAAQRRKCEAMLARAAVPPGGRLLEIGCGWGTLALMGARAGCSVEAISLSDDQLAWCRAQPVPSGGTVVFRKQDYRDVARQYDSIVSVEMVEALGREYWPAFMDSLARNLKPGGRAAIQLISIREALFESYARNADFIQAYVFPGGLLIRTREFRRLAEERGLTWTAQVDFGADYAETLRIWRGNFDAAIAQGRLPTVFDGRFCDLWRYYLMYCEGGFRGGGIEVSQVTLVRR